MATALDHYSLKSAAAVLKVSCDEDAQFNRVCTDSRTLQAGDLFVALIGPNFDGHDHLEQAKQRGAVAAIVSKMQNINLLQLKVENTRLALAELAKARRLVFQGKVVGLTGSNGKTTVKEFIAAILRQDGKVLATQGNLNNDIGVPLTLLSLAGDEDYAVIEMGANHHGEIAFLTDITKPDVALITNAGAAHLEGFGSVEGVSRAKGEIYRGLTNNGIAIVNFDDQYSEYWQTLTEKHIVIGFGIDVEDAAVRAMNVNQQQDGTLFRLITPHAETEIRLSLPGLHNVRNALAATAVAVALDIDLQKVKSALEAIQPVKGRLSFVKGHNGAWLIDDTYNANRDSMNAAIDVLSQKAGKKIVVMGDLFESGEKAKAIHEEIGRYALEKGVDQFYAVGDLCRNAVNAFGDNAKHFADKASLIEELLKGLNSDSIVLIKGSRGMRMEEVVQQLQQGA